MLLSFWSNKSLFSSVIQSLTFLYTCFLPSSGSVFNSQPFIYQISEATQVLWLRQSWYWFNWSNWHTFWDWNKSEIATMTGKENFTQMTPFKSSRRIFEALRKTLSRYLHLKSECTSLFCIIIENYSRTSWSTKFKIYYSFQFI